VRVLSVLLEARVLQQILLSSEGREMLVLPL